MIFLTQGKVQNASGMTVPHGSITLQLNVDATIVASPNGLAVAEPVVNFQFDDDGNILPNAPDTEAQIYSNAELNPQNAIGLGTYYLVTIYDANGARLNKSPMLWQFPQASGSTVDISQMVPVSTVGGNVIFYPKPGTVTSVSFTGDGTIFSATPSAPISASGTLMPVLLNQAVNTVFAGPASGGNGLPTFRALTVADLPGGGGNPPGGSDGNLQFNSSGSFGGVPGSSVTADGTITLTPSGSSGDTALTLYAENVGGADALDLFSASSAGAFGVFFQTNGSNGDSIRILLTDTFGDQSSMDANGFGFSNGAGGSVFFGQNNALGAVNALTVVGSTAGSNIQQWYPHGAASPSLWVSTAGALVFGASTFTFSTLPGSPTAGTLLYCSDAQGGQDGATWNSVAAGSGTGALLCWKGSAWLVIG